MTNVFVSKTGDAIKQTGAKALVVGGGVIANQYLRENLTKLTESRNIPIFLPGQGLSTDNAVMIAMAAYLNTFNTEVKVNPEITANGNLSL